MGNTACTHKLEGECSDENDARSEQCTQEAHKSTHKLEVACSDDDDSRSEQCTQEALEDKAPQKKRSLHEERHASPKRQCTEWMTEHGKLSPQDYFERFGSTRDERADCLLREKAHHIRELGSGRWFVPSQSGMADGYEVCLSGGSPTCTCPDFVKRQSACKHIKVVRSLP